MLLEGRVTCSLSSMFHSIVLIEHAIAILGVRGWCSLEQSSFALGEISPFAIQMNRRFARLIAYFEEHYDFVVRVSYWL